MKYNVLGKTGIRVSEIGLGCEHLQDKPYEQIADTVHAALNGGVNIMDVFMSQPQVRTDIGKALKGRRQDVVLQGHIGAVWLDGQYNIRRDVDNCRIFFNDLLTRYDTDYIDLGMLHFVDDMEQLRAIENGPLMEYVAQLKREGRIRALGMSCHNPVVAKYAAQSGWLDVIMFSLNPAYDLLPGATVIDDFFKLETFRQDGLIGINPDRAALYEACLNNGVGITVMKGFAAGMLLKESYSPFRKAFTPSQLIHYALTRPAVASILVGCQTRADVEAALAYESATDEEKDYAAALIGTSHYSLDGQCMYCNHCLPCPAHIDIAAVNKYLDMTVMDGQPAETVLDHYNRLAHHAGECVGCGACEKRCPFRVRVIGCMQRAEKVFGK